MKLRLAERAAIGGRRKTEGDRELAARARDPVAAELIVGVDDRRAGTRQMVEQLAFGDADAAQRAEALEMRLGRVRDDADRRLRELREIVDLAGMVRTELDDESVVLGGQPHQRQRHADVVVQVALRDADRAADAQDRSDELLDRRLAAAARDGDRRDGERRTPRARHGTQRAARVPHLDLRQRRRGEPRHERAGGTFRERFIDEVVAVEPIARDRDEQRTRAERARIRRHGAERLIDTDEAPLHLARDRCERSRHHGATPRISATTARSLKARRSAPTSCSAS